MMLRPDDEPRGGRSGAHPARLIGPMLGVLGSVWLSLLGGCVEPDVVRVVDGERSVGRYVSAAAYAAYARGAEAEARGHDELALRAFLAAVDHDDESVELWTRIGALRCRLEKVSGSEEAFEHAERLDGDYEPLWRSRAQCAALRGQPERAVAAARKAASLDPDRQETVLLTARALEQSGAVEQGGRWFRAAVVKWPNSATAWRALRDFARRVDDSVALSWATASLHGLSRTKLAQSQRGRPKLSPPSSGSRWRAVDRAIQRGELRRARIALRRAKLDPRMLAPRAIALGKPSLAVEQAAHLFAADPADTDSRLALALGADLLGKRDRLTQLLDLPPDALAPSGVGRLLLAELLQRHVGAVVAQRWLDDSLFVAPAGDADRSSDLRRRLRARLGGPVTDAARR